MPVISRSSSGGWKQQEQQQPGQCNSLDLQSQLEGREEEKVLLLN